MSTSFPFTILTLGNFLLLVGVIPIFFFGLVSRDLINGSQVHELFDGCRVRCGERLQVGLVEVDCEGDDAGETETGRMTWENEIMGKN